MSNSSNSNDLTADTPDAGTTAAYRRRRASVITITILLAFAYGLQMYSPVPAFGALSAEFSLNLTQIGLLVSMFFFGYAAGHIPAGFAAAAYGLHKVAVAGAVMLALSTLLLAFANDYWVMLLARGLGGVAMSLMAGAAFPLATAWAPRKYTRVIVGGLMNGVGFTGGSAVGLYVWTILLEWMDWRQATMIAAGFGGLIAILALIFIRIPKKYADELAGGAFDWKSTGRALRSRSMWAIGIGSVGAYGALFTVSQLGPGYAQTEYGFSAETASLLGVVMLLLGIPGALIGGTIADRSKRFLPVLWIPAALLIVLLILMPLSNDVVIWVVLAGIGLLGTLYFSPATVSPSEYPEIPPKDFATAFGLVLTLGNLGAVIYPYIYTTGAEFVGPNASWWFLAIASTLAFIGFFFAKEPRGRKRTQPAGST